ncbi:MAG: hypothetical protein LUG62_08590 [Clostridiales bacterium]|nr:hypothetical protein [Clostridiales bacterium]
MGEDVGPGQDSGEDSYAGTEENTHSYETGDNGPDGWEDNSGNGGGEGNTWGDDSWGNGGWGDNSGNGDSWGNGGWGDDSGSGDSWGSGGWGDNSGSGDSWGSGGWEDNDRSGDNWGDDSLGDDGFGNDSRENDQPKDDSWADGSWDENRREDEDWDGQDAYDGDVWQDENTWENGTGGDGRHKKDGKKRNFVPVGIAIVLCAAVLAFFACRLYLVHEGKADHILPLIGQSKDDTEAEEADTEDTDAEAEEPGDSQEDEAGTVEETGAPTATPVEMKSASSSSAADASDNEISGIDPDEEYTTESEITFTAIGAGMENEKPQTGDTRYVPKRWLITQTNSWDSEPYEATFRIGKAGSHTLIVTFEQQEYDGSDWTGTGEQDTKSVSFTVSEAPVTATPTPEATATPTPTPVPSASLVSLSDVVLDSSKLITVADATATSVISQETVDNYPILVFDDNTETNWQEGVDGSGIGEGFTATFQETSAVKYITFRLGNWKTDEYYVGNNRPKTLTITLGSFTTQVTFPDEHEQFCLELSPACEAKSMSITIVDVYAGTSWDDTVITDISLYRE